MGFGSFAKSAATGGASNLVGGGGRVQVSKGAAARRAAKKAGPPADRKAKKRGIGGRVSAIAKRRSGPSVKERAAGPTSPNRGGRNAAAASKARKRR